MNRFAYHMSGYAIKAFSGLSKTNVRIHESEEIPDSNASLIFTANHFTRMETIFLPYYIHNIIKKPIWSLASADLFQGGLKGVLDSMGAISTRAENRDYLIVKNLLSGDGAWIIFPEGMMVKNKKLMNQDSFQISNGRESLSPHTGAAALALQTEFYRERLRRMSRINPGEFDRITRLFQLGDPDKVMNSSTFIVPVNITYYPVRAKTNMLSTIAEKLMENPSQRLMDELMTEGTMVLSGVDVDIRFGEPIPISPYMKNGFMESDLTSRRRKNFGQGMVSNPVMKHHAREIMQTYMGDVYSLTTLNFDHIFATLLKYLPGNEIHSFDLRCMAFLAVSAVGKIEGIRLHTSLKDNPIHLLTDDRFNRFKNFIQAAAETCAVEFEGEKVFLNRGCFHGDFEFHSIRIKNPVAVMANEIEPLLSVTAFLKKLARSSRKKIQEMVLQQLLVKARKDYNISFNKFYIPDETRPGSIGAPILLPGKNQDTGILLVHGYMAAPAEMQAFGNYLNQRGYTVYIPRLAGHGTAPEDLAETSYAQWVDSVEEGYAVLKFLAQKIWVGGFSTGAGLALDLAARVDDVAGVAAVAPPMKFMDYSTRLVPAIDIWNRAVKRAHLGQISKEYIANDPENPHINYIRNPISGVRQLELFMEALEPRLKSITMPAIVVQSRRDPVVNPDGSEKLFRKLGSSFKEFHLFDFNRHGIMLGRGRERVFRAILDFWESIQEREDISGTGNGEKKETA